MKSLNSTSPVKAVTPHEQTLKKGIMVRSNLKNTLNKKKLQKHGITVKSIKTFVITCYGKLKKNT